ncbi:MAG: amidohydrolase [Candidatus Aminicenantes bacterium]|nr:amidohydrolase [Candidatus Aminicenantes bacterium]
MEKLRSDNNKNIADLKDEISALAGEVVRWRRDFHRHPEIANQETRTSGVIRRFFEDLGFPVRSAAGTGLIAVLEGAKRGKTVALRADMDALPLQEEGEKEYKSLNPGAAHACGHDGHMAILMGAAKILAGRKGHLQGRVVFLFQPAEERPPGGAKRMLEEGALDGVDAVFGLHLWQPLPAGSIGIVKGPMMAQSDEFSLLVKGKGGHGSMPHTAIDPILVASQIVVNVQTIVSRNIDPLKPCVVSFGTVSGGTVFNIIPSEVSLSGTVRSFDASVQDLAERRLREIAGETARAFGASCILNYVKGYPALVNHAEMVDFVTGVAAKVLGESCHKPIEPIMGGEDFAYYLEKVLGAFFFFGAGDGCPFPHHHPAFEIDEKALPQAVLLMTSLALEFLGG